MRFLKLVIPLIVITTLLAACQSDPLVEPDPNPDPTEFATSLIDPEVAAYEIMQMANYPFDPEVEIPERLTGARDKSFGNLLTIDREDLGDGIAHYSFTLRVGWGDHDQVMLHRVVKERRPYCPARTTGNIFLQHGDAVGFVKFLFGPNAPSAPDDHAAAIHLARGGVDVWGIDQNWVLVPPDATDFGAMQGWGMDNQVSNVRIAMGVARFVRLFSGGGFGKMNLLGYSSGGMTGYATINEEAGMPEHKRHVGGFVCADMNFKYGPEMEEYRLNNCADVDYFGDLIAAGEYAEPIVFVPVGELAALDPDSDSPIFPGFTNLQVALYFGAATFDAAPYHPTWHYWGGTFDPESGLPVDFNFTSIDGATDFMRTGCAWEARPFMKDYARILCDEEDVPWDDNLGAVEVPVLYIEPVGGLGAAGRYALGMLGSADIEIATASLLPPEQIIMDFGHIDIWTADQAPELVWQPLLEWILAHTDDDCRRGPRWHRD